MFHSSLSVSLHLYASLFPHSLSISFIPSLSLSLIITRHVICFFPLPSFPLSHPPSLPLHSSNTPSLLFLNSAIIGEINEDLDLEIDFSQVRAEPLDPVVH